MTFDNDLSPEECFQWCKEQHFADDYSGLWIIFTAILFLMLYYAISTWYWKIVEQSNIKTEDLHKFMTLLPKVTLYLLLAFIIYVLFFQ